MIADGHGKCCDGLLGTTSGQKGATPVAGERTKVAVGGVVERVGVAARRVRKAAEPHVTVAKEVIDGTGHLARLLCGAELSDGSEYVTATIGGLARLK